MTHRYQKIIGIGLLLAVGLMGVSRVALAQQRVPDATASITLTSLAFIGGIEWGKGTLTFKGHDYTFKVKGLKAGAIGIRRDSVNARVYNLKKAKDFGST